MKGYDNGFTVIIACIAIFLVGLASGAVLCGWDEDRYRQQAIKRGYAEHSRTTGQWQWVEPGVREVRTIYGKDSVTTETYKAKTETAPGVLE